MSESARQYHLAELRIALDPGDPRHLLPQPEGCTRFLDVGCGAGQTLIALGGSTLSVGIDVDHKALMLGRELTPSVRFAEARGESLPFRDGSFDFVLSRVALPYMNIPAALQEMRRVMIPGGSLWLALHDISIPAERFRSGNLKSRLFATYVLANGLTLHLFGRTFPFLTGGYESFQTTRGMTTALKRAGFRDIDFERRQNHFLVKAKSS